MGFEPRVSLCGKPRHLLAYLFLVTDSWCLGDPNLVVDVCPKLFVKALYSASKDSNNGRWTRLFWLGSLVNIVRPLWHWASPHKACSVPLRPHPILRSTTPQRPSSPSTIAILQGGIRSFYNELGHTPTTELGVPKITTNLLQGTQVSNKMSRFSTRKR